MMDIVAQVALKLENHGIQSGRVNAEIMLGDILGCQRADLYINDIKLSDEQLKQLDEMVSRRIDSEPLQYITGKANFYGHEFFIQPGIFIPRPETEVLVETVLSLITQYAVRSTQYEPLIFEIGTGSGNIAISLTKAFTRCKIIASDISGKTIALAKGNASLHGVSERIEFIKANLFDIPESYKGSFDIIVSNPPYIAHEELENLADDVKREPVQALDGGPDGISFYSRIIKESPLFLKRGGMIALELADGICHNVKELFKRSGTFKDISVFNDLNGIERAITATNVGHLRSDLKCPTFGMG